MGRGEGGGGLWFRFTDEFSGQIHGHEYMDNIKYLF